MKIGKSIEKSKLFLHAEIPLFSYFAETTAPWYFRKAMVFLLLLPRRSGLHEAATFNFRYGPINTELQNICSPNLHLFFSEFLFYYGNNVINHPFQTVFITAFSHDADERFRA